MSTLTGALTLPLPPETLPLTDSDDDLLSSSGWSLLTAGYVMGELRTNTQTLGALTATVPTLAGTVAMTKTLSGAMTLPGMREAMLLTSPTYSELDSIPSSWILMTPRNLYGEVVVTHSLSGALTLPAISVAGVAAAASAGLTSAITLPAITTHAIRTGRSRRTVIFMNEESKAFDNTKLNTYLDSKFEPHGTGTSTISGSGPFDTTNNIDGQLITLAATPAKRSVTLRAPELGNKQRPSINPRIQTAMDGKWRSYVETPLSYDITLSWKILPCDDLLPTRLLALLYFDKIRYVIGDDTWQLVLLDDVYKVVQEARFKQSITLNFRGKRIT